MNDFSLMASSLKARKLNAAMSILLTAFGVALCVILLCFSQHLQSRLSDDGQGFGVVIGAKGSALQIVLSSVYHVDIPTGNIPLAEFQKWSRHKDVKMAIPLALGDSYKGYRIVGSTQDYPAHYQATLKEGVSWSKPFEVTAGSDTGLKVGDVFEGSHGLGEGGHEHHEHAYKVVGVLNPTHTVIDRLLLTSVESVQELHEHHEEESGGHDHAEEEHADGEITALLLQTKSPMANINLPRQINRNESVMAANPAYEMARLSSMLGFGGKTLGILSTVLLAIAMLSLFSGIAGGMDNRMNDLAVLRALGFSKGRLVKIVAGEGMVMTFAGLALGYAIGIVGFSLMAQAIAPLKASGAHAVFAPSMIYLGLSVIAAGLIASLVPSLRIMKINVASQLAKGV